MFSNLWNWLASTTEDEKEHIVQNLGHQTKLKRSLKVVEELGDLDDNGVLLTEEALLKRTKAITKAKTIIKKLEDDLDRFTALQIQAAVEAYKQD